MSAAMMIILIGSVGPQESPVTWNPADKDASVTLSNGNLDMANTDSTFSAARANIGRSKGRKYFEIFVPSVLNSASKGIAASDFSLADYVGNSAHSAGLLNTTPIQSGWVVQNSMSATQDAANDYYGFAVDFNLGYMWVSHNGTWLVGNPSAAVLTPASSAPWVSNISGEVFPTGSLYSTGSWRLHANTFNIQGTMPTGFAPWGIPWAEGLGVGAGFAMVGDSITALYLAGTNWPTLTGNANAANYGVPSNTSAQTLARFDSITSMHPRAIFLMSGVNDVGLGVPASTTAANIASMITKSQEVGIPIYVQAILHVTSSYAAPYVAFNASIDATNSAIHSAVTAAGAGATWLDWNSGGVLLGTDYQADGIHLNSSGDAKWAAALSSYFALFP